MSFNYKSSELTKNLKTIEFEAVIGHENAEYLPLRSRSHCLFINACFHVYYYVNIYDLFRKACLLVKKKGPTASFTKFSLSVQEKPEEALNVGLVGFGRLGSGILNELIGSKIIPAENIYIHTRNKDSINIFKEKPINFDEDCSQIAEKCLVILICVPPSQLENVASMLRSKLPFEAVIYVFSTGVPLDRLHRLFQHENIITEQYLWNDKFHHNWNHQISLSVALETEEIINETCPLDISTTKAIYINCLQKLFTLWIFSLCNIGSTFNLSEELCVKLLNFVLLHPDSESTFQTSYIVQNSDPKRILPKFSLCSITKKSTYLDEKLALDDKLRKKLMENYTNTLLTFSSYKKFNVD